MLWSQWGLQSTSSLEQGDSLTLECCLVTQVITEVEVDLMTEPNTKQAARESLSSQRAL